MQPRSKFIDRILRNLTLSIKGLNYKQQERQRFCWDSTTIGGSSLCINHFVFCTCSPWVSTLFPVIVVWLHDGRSGWRKFPFLTSRSGLSWIRSDAFLVVVWQIMRRSSGLLSLGYCSSVDKLIVASKMASWENGGFLMGTENLK